MRRILNSRFFRLLICLVLVCCFLVNSSPIKAKASITALVSTAPAWVPVATAAAAIVIALGVMASADHTSFNTVVSDVVTYLETSTTYVVNGMVAVWGVFGADQITRSYVLKDMIQDVWCWLFDSGLVLSDSGFMTDSSGGTVYFCNNFYYSSPTLSVSKVYWINEVANGKTSYGYATYVYGLGEMYRGDTVDEKNAYMSYAFYPDSGGTVYYASHQMGLLCLDEYWAANEAELISDGYSLISADSVGASLNYHLAHTSVYSPIDGLVLGQIQAPTETEQMEDVEVYTDYITKIEFCPDGRPDYGDDKKEHLPIGLPSTDLDDLLLSQTQEQGQSGESNLDFDFETSTDPDPGTGEPGTGTDPDSGSSGSSSWTPPSDYTQFQLVDLKNFFPFCIPFDLFEFFKLLHAEPVAPVLHWEIQDLAGQTYSLSVDLSEWDSVALLFRRLQLFLFITGLAAASRKFIKW